MTVTRDRRGEKLERFDVCRNIYQSGNLQFYYYIGSTEMAEFRGKMMALFSNVNTGGCVHAYERRNGQVEAMEKIPDLSGLTAEAQKRVKEEIAKFEFYPPAQKSS